MTLQVKEFYEKPLIVILCIKKRMDAGLKTTPTDIAKETGLSQKVVYTYFENLAKDGVLEVIRKDKMRIRDIRLTQEAPRELYNQTLEVLQENIRPRVEKIIQLHDSGVADITLNSGYGNAIEGFNGWVNTEYMNAAELHNVFVDTSPWPVVSEECELWTKATRAYLEGQHLSWANYFWTIEHNLNTIIYYLASTLNFLLYMNFESCDCTGEIGEDGIMHYIQQQEAAWVANEDGPWTKEWLVKYELANIISLFGLVMALITVSVVKRLNILIVV